MVPFLNDTEKRCKLFRCELAVSHLTHNLTGSVQGHIDQHMTSLYARLCVCYYQRMTLAGLPSLSSGSEHGSGKQHRAPSRFPKKIDSPFHFRFSFLAETG